jgi:TRAP-type C4-dicarboxylate transport system permease small subunit
MSLAWVKQGLTVGLNFLRNNVPESSARLCAVLCCVTACLCAPWIIVFAFRHADQALMVTALVGLLTALIASGCVAIINRRDGPPQ